MGLQGRPSSRTQYHFSLHCISLSWAHACFTEKQAWEVNRIGQGSVARWLWRLRLGTPVLQCKPLHSWGLLPTLIFSQLFSPSFMDYSVLARPTWQGRAGGAGLPQPDNQPLPPKPMPVSLPTLAAFAVLCVTHLLFCLKLPTSFIIDSSLSFQVSPLHDSTNFPLS